MPRKNKSSTKKVTIVDQWLNSKKVSAKDKSLIKKMSPAEIKVNFDNSLMTFGTAGIRAKMGPGTKQFNEFTYTQAAYGYAKYISKKFKNPSVVIGHDNRLNSGKYSLLCAKVLSSFGIKVYLFKKNELMPTPIISFAIRQLNASGGIIITASHNPKEYNGFKAYNPNGAQILPYTANEISKCMPKPRDILSIEYKPKLDMITYLEDDIVNKYLSAAKNVIIDKNVLKATKTFPIIFTGHHGTACKLLPKFLASLGFNIIPVEEQCYADSYFSHSPSSNPELIQSFDLAIKYANKNNAKIIIGVDPDADRMAVMINHEGKWRLMTGNEMGIIYTWYVLNNKEFKKQPYVVSSWVSTNLIDKICADFKAKIYRTGTGFKWMGALISFMENRKDLVVAFEEAIGALNTTINRDKDSFTASALALEIYSKYISRKMDLVDILEKVIYPKYGYWYGQTIPYNYSKVINWKSVVKTKLTALKKFKAPKVGPYKLVKVYWNTQGDCLDWLLEGNNWIRFRASGTEPIFKVYYNLYAKDKFTLNKNLEQVNKVITSILK